MNPTGVNAPNRVWIDTKHKVSLQVRENGDAEKDEDGEEVTDRKREKEEKGERKKESGKD